MMSPPGSASSAILAASTMTARPWIMTRKAAFMAKFLMIVDHLPSFRSAFFSMACFRFLNGAAARKAMAAGQLMRQRT